MSEWQKAADSSDLNQALAEILRFIGDENEPSDLAFQNKFGIPLERLQEHSVGTVSTFIETYVKNQHDIFNLENWGTLYMAGFLAGITYQKNNQGET